MKKDDIISAIEQLVISRAKGVEKDFLDSTDTCLFLGISKSTLYKKNYNKEIPYFKPDGSKKIYYHRDALINYITKNKILSEQEQEEKAQNFLKPKK